MNFSKHWNQSFLVLIAILVMSCNAPRRLYVKNKTGKAITIHIDKGLENETGTTLSAFRDSLQGKRIEPGHIIINFDSHKKWNRQDEAYLITVLQNTRIQKEDNTVPFTLPKNIKIGHGIFIPELILTIDAPNTND